MFSYKYLLASSSSHFLDFIARKGTPTPFQYCTCITYTYFCCATNYRVKGCYAPMFVHIINPLWHCPSLIPEGSNVRQVHGVAREMEIRINSLIVYPLRSDKLHGQMITVTL